ncbi:MAG: hypothetical protein FJZ98_04915 [Chloroflexi bacterium]|nr:hypothetical protein [Chloroflexota bacterium]
MEPQKKPVSFRKALIIILFTLGFLGIAFFTSVAMLILRMQSGDLRLPIKAVDPLETPQDSLDPETSTYTSSIDDRVKRLIAVDQSTLDILIQEDIPINDPIELAERLGGISDAPVFKSEPPPMRSVGDSRNFWVLDVDSNEYRKITANLLYITPHLYFWSEEGIEVELSAVAELAETFENEIYPTNRQIFGSEWTPGVDHDEHLTILYAKGLGGAAGYFSSTDSLTREVETYSNETEMFYLSADYTRPDSLYTYGVLAHELQHMIHWNIDRNESAWVSEGLSELAVELNGYEPGGFTFYFAIDPDIQLNFWPGNDQGDSTPHYGASYLFMKYLMDHFGLESIRELVANGKVGLSGVDETYRTKDSELEMGFTSEKIFQDWSIANYAASSGTTSVEIGYQDPSVLPPFFPVETLSCDSGWQSRTVSQFGSDYIAIDCPGTFRLEVIGKEEVSILPIDPYSGDSYFWSNYGDSSSMTLTQTFDFRNVEGPIGMNYWTWFDLERDYDYLYLLASIDGENWEILNPTRCTRDDPTGSNYDCGYNGRTGDWVNETVDLTKYIGNQVTLQFEYVTDLAVNGDGFVIDDITIEGIRYFSDFESDDGGWEGRGFVRVKNSLPQNFGYSAIGFPTSGEIEKVITVGGLNIHQVLNQSDQDSQLVIVINGLTRFTRIPAGYRMRVTSLGSS